MQLIKGKFKSQDALTIITQLVDIKIRFHEEKIDASENEEDIKMRENRIKELQKYLKQTRDYLIDNPGEVSMEGLVNINAWENPTEEFCLINGTFRPQDAKDILLEAFNNKIKFHNLQAFSKRERGESGAEIHDARMAELRSTLENVIQVLDISRKANKNVSINCMVSLNIESGRKNELVSQQAVGYSY